MTQFHRSADLSKLIDQVIGTLGKDIRIGLPLGLGKPTEFVNALYQRAKADPTLKLTILTALSLEKPKPASSLEAAFLNPVLERVWGDCPDLQYAVDQTQNALPPNVLVREFYFRPGSRLKSASAQQQYVCANYTFAAREVFNQGCNLAAQLICLPDQGVHDVVSLSCNPDTSIELVRCLKASGRPHLVIGQVNKNLPYMAGDAEVPTGMFDHLIEVDALNHTLFSTPKTPVGLADYLIGLRASALIEDGGTLQVGIGSLGDALVHALVLRHTQNTDYKKLIENFGFTPRELELTAEEGGTAPFEKGLYAATEMFIDGFVELYKAGVLKRKVYDHWALQTLFNRGEIEGEQIRPDWLDKLAELGVREIDESQLAVFKRHGLFVSELSLNGISFCLPGTAPVVANLADPAARQWLREHALGDRLKNGAVLHGGFFLGPASMYRFLRELSANERALFQMTGVEKVNQLDLNPVLYKAQRRSARFVNTGLMVTLSGAVASDGLDSGAVISGVGGQYNFVAMAHQLQGARSVLLIRAVREQPGQKPLSNVLFNYGHCTIPRHLRDIVITEYGIADLRSKTDNEIAKALINIADSRFQEMLLVQAQAAGKIEPGYKVPAEFRNNLPGVVQARLLQGVDHAVLPQFPFGTDFTQQEQRLMDALLHVKEAAAIKSSLRLAFDTLFEGGDEPSLSAQILDDLKRMKLDAPSTFKEKVTRHLLIKALKEVHADA
ncbi:acetyl-CoA hydrolase/transferase C-terminal domain-containing protein [Limnobacter litoralis]|uniref:Acetyl-CoA hydrolase/transferase C-terminal domain-containing protein n=1 Tax=Limnobacter litoralis TaxID=481366 RepID=A0ABQ5YVQ0_9BURK|nr:acetyl-CoA hydrolase/transferase C-terminal domain-containing protein [Limnobacter litoralis]GLR26552.1 hypothetical protein GCM10007875_16420 [Limnobacter litoralis]